MNKSSMMTTKRVAVIGAGIMGVSTAINIQSECPDAEVSILSAEFTPDTTSDGAAGFMVPYLAPGTPQEDIVRWFVATWNQLSGLIQGPQAAAAGVHFSSGYNLFKDKQPAPMWKDLVIGFRVVPEAELEQYFPGFKYGWFFTSIICSSHRYIPFLMEKFQEKGGKLIRRKLGSFGELCGQYDVVVNCSGLGSRFLAQDESVEPVRGQVIKVQAPWIKVCNRYQGDPCGADKHYVYSGQDDITVGGTAQLGRWDTEVDPKDAKAIWDRACSITPSLKDAKILRHWVGLRPQRSKGIRVEAETRTYGSEKLKVVHNYGHGGCGITLHWGCAQDAAKLVKEELQRAPMARL